jgi:hypothetical protein
MAVSLRYMTGGHPGGRASAEPVVRRSTRGGPTTPEATLTKLDRDVSRPYRQPQRGHHAAPSSARPDAVSRAGSSCGPAAAINPALVNRGPTN